MTIAVDWDVRPQPNEFLMSESFPDYSWIQDFEADFP